MKKYLWILSALVWAKAFTQGNVGIGTTAPNSTAILHLDAGANNSRGLLITGASNFSGSIPSLGAGARMMFYPGRAAIRAGIVSGTHWNNDKVGFHSAAFGNDVTASGIYAFASGYSTTASGTASTAAGYFSKAKGFGSTVVGMYNDSLLTLDQFAADPSTPLFIVGNGDDNTTLSNAFVVRKDGNVGIGNFNPQYRLDVGNRMRIRSGGDVFSSPGVWLNRINNSATAAFIGMVNDNHAGIWGDLGAGWQFVMNTVNGNVGIGTATPVNKLDVNGAVNFTGELKLNNNSGNPGQVLVSNGATAPSWQSIANPQVGFTAKKDEDQLIPHGGNITVAPYFFAFNDGNNLNPVTGIFTAPSNGMYHFTMQLRFSSNPNIEMTVLCRLYIDGNIAYDYLAISKSYSSNNFSCNLKLTAGNAVSLVVSQLNGTAINLVSLGTFFSGYKVY